MQPAYEQPQDVRLSRARGRGDKRWHPLAIQMWVSERNCALARQMGGGEGGAGCPTPGSHTPAMLARAHGHRQM